MTSEFDIPMQALGIALKRTQDPIARKAIEGVLKYLDDLHYFSHAYAMGKKESPMSPRYDKRTDHWMSKIPTVYERIREIDRFLDEVAELERKQKQEELLCQNCHDKAPGHLEDCGNREAGQIPPDYRIVECQADGLCFCPKCSPEYWKDRKIEQISDTSWRVPK